MLLPAARGLVLLVGLGGAAFRAAEDPTPEPNRGGDPAEAPSGPRLPSSTQVWLGVETRLGEAADGWRLELEGREQKVQIILRPPDGDALDFALVPEGESTEDLARDLAAFVSLQIENYEPRSTNEAVRGEGENGFDDDLREEPSPTPSTQAPQTATALAAAPVEAPPKLWFLQVGGRLTTPAPFPEGELSLGRMAWKQRLQLRLLVGGGSTRRSELSLSEFRGGLAIALGIPLEKQHMWLGAYGSVAGHGWFAAEGERTARGAGMGFEGSAVARFGWRALRAELRGGAHGLAPALRVESRERAIARSGRGGALSAHFGIAF